MVTTKKGALKMKTSKKVSKFEKAVPVKGKPVKSTKPVKKAMVTSIGYIENAHPCNNPGQPMAAFRVGGRNWKCWNGTIGQVQAFIKGNVEVKVTGTESGRTPDGKTEYAVYSIGANFGAQSKAA
jgi:hypothetical protein